MAWIFFGALPCRKKKTWWQLAPRCCWNRARPWYASELVSFLVRLNTYQHPVDSVSMIILYVIFRHFIVTGVVDVQSGGSQSAPNTSTPTIYSDTQVRPLSELCLPACTHVTTRETLKRFSRNFISASFNKITSKLSECCCIKLMVGFWHRVDKSRITEF